MGSVSGGGRWSALIEEATVDAYNESEQTTGFFTMLEEHLRVPFSTQVLEGRHGTGHAAVPGR